MRAKNDFQFALINLTKKLNKTTLLSSYNDTMSENFQELEKKLKKKMIILINNVLKIKRLDQTRTKLQKFKTRKSKRKHKRNISNAQNKSNDTKNIII